MEIVVIFSLVVGILLLNRPVTMLFQRLYTRQQFKRFVARETFYHSVISRYLKYYNRLNLEEQRKFLFRTYLFQHSRNFHYIEVEEAAEMPILVSAAAVQLTFGLDKFKLNYFDDIFILRDDYHYGFYSRPFMGHVDQTGIYLSWDNFIKGISGQTPNCNVGLHEMGHALAYVNFITRTEEDRHFKQEFPKFSKVARPIFTSMQQGGAKNLLGEYAATNYHEFWAVAVEVFFENPVQFRHELPELYESMSRVLNQDPLNFITGNTTIIRRAEPVATTAEEPIFEELIGGA
ncbi:MAG TPA: zinc-dependent peptidase [Puia sp.]|jgi:Mlc titration factor MtfA (ptsG expression regulator)|nr:zinc-dependent peptidase [Puia sp.]